MGVVLKAFEPALDRTVALKMISPQLAGHPRLRDRFTQEARAAAAILHENVVTVFTVGKYRGVSFLVMEYVDGLSIQDHFKNRRRFRPSEIVRVGRECALGLAAAHRLGIVHRDVAYTQIEWGWITLPEKAYYVSKAPLSIDLVWIVIINCFSIVWSALVLFLPLSLINRIQPVRALRFA